MANLIHNSTIFIECMALTDSQAFGAGEIIGFYKDPYRNGKWITRDSNKKLWGTTISDLRNENYYTVVNQYSMSDIIDWLTYKNENYETVLTEFLIDAVETTLKEAHVCTIEDIYNYINENLL